MDRHTVPLAVCPTGTCHTVSSFCQTGTSLCQSGSAICPPGSFTNKKKEEGKEKSFGANSELRSVAFLSQKGGAGKTTLAVHTAVAAQQSGERVTVIDTDPQGSATAWHATRQIAHEPSLVRLDAARVHAHMYTCNDKTLCIVDCAPHAGPDAATIARSVKLVLIPIRPSAFDLAAAKQTVEIVRKAKARAAFVLSACPSRAPEIEEARAALADYGLPICRVPITERRAFARAVASGQAVSEFEPYGKAATEIHVLWHWIKGLLTEGSE